MPTGDWLSYELGDGFQRHGVDGAHADLRTRRARDVDLTILRRDEAIADGGLQSAAALPLGGPRRAKAGVIILISRTPREPENGLTRLLERDRRPDHVIPAATRGRVPHRGAGDPADLERRCQRWRTSSAAENDLLAAQQRLPARHAT